MNRTDEQPRKHLPVAPYESAMTAFTKSAMTVAAVTVGMLAALACGKPKEEPLSQATTTSAAVRALASCETIEEQGTCTDYSSSSGSFGIERSLCRSAHGEFRLSACPTRGRIGSCVVEDGELKRYYEGGDHGFTAASARADCERSGLDSRFLAAR